MTFEKAMVILFTKVAQTVIAERFTHTFFDNDGNRVRKVFAYLFSVFIAIFVNLFFYKPIFNFLSIFLGLSAIALSYNGTIKRKCIFVFYILAVSCIIDLVVSAFLIKPFGYDGYSAFVSIFALLLLHAAQLITERFFGNDLGIELNNRYWLFIIASLLVCIITSIVIFMDKTVSSFSLSLVCGAFLLVNIIISYLMDDLVKSSQTALENQVLRDQVSSYEREIMLQNENMEALRSFRHDMKRHFAEISVLASTGEIEQIKNYVSAMENNLVESRRLVDSGNTALDTVLNYMLQRAVDKKIQLNVKVVVPSDLKLSAYDMNIIFGNLLENAIEAQKDVKNPSIDLEINYLMDSLVVRTQVGVYFYHPCHFRRRLLRFFSAVLQYQLWRCLLVVDDYSFQFRIASCFIRVPVQAGQSAGQTYLPMVSGYKWYCRASIAGRCGSHILYRLQFPG